MEQPIHPDRIAMRAIEDQIRECFGRVVYSHKAHEKTADLLTRRLARIKGTQIVLSAIITAGLITALFGSPDQSKVAVVTAAVISTALLALNTYTKDIDLGRSAEKHKETAAQLWAVRESYLSILADLCAEISSPSDVRSHRDQLQMRLESIYAAAPRTVDAAYKKAGIALKEREEFTFSEAEIDRFLPAALRRKSEIARDV
jgi:hypothetical protein